MRSLFSYAGLNLRLRDYISMDICIEIYRVVDTHSVNPIFLKKVSKNSIRPPRVKP